MPGLKKRASLHTLGCRLNQSETNILAEKLTEAGYELVPFGDSADLAIINTCTVTHEADAKSRKLVRQFIRANPEAYTAVIGCYAQMGAKALAEIEGVDLIIGNQEKLNVLDYVAAGKNDAALIVRDRIERDDFEIEFSGVGVPLHRRANLKIQDGCDFMCSFCVIPFARGRARSRALDNLLEEARSLVARGAKELVLTGVNIGTYAWEGKSVLEVIAALNDLEGVARLRISSIEPTTIPDELFAWMADPAHKLVPYLHVPLQAGSDQVLERMRRKYTRAEYINFMRRAAAAVPGIGLGTDIMVGFPGETEEDFAQTLGVLEETDLFYAHVFKYSERAGTASARMPERSDPRVSNARGARLRKASAAKFDAFARTQVGREVEVLFEQAENGLWSGYTGNYLRVVVPSNDCLENELRLVRLTGVHGDILSGELA
jgi:threonylcarbamoyladenosine tRNA methylthiotransferase MtaB